MGGLKFLITLFVIYLIFRSIMRKVLSAVNSEGGGAIKGKLGDVIEQMKQEMERAKLEAEREAAGMDDEMDEEMDEDLWAEVREAGEDSFEERPFFPEEILENAEASPAPSRELWDEADETPSYWDSPEEEAAPVAAAEVATPAELCRARRKRRGRLQEAVLWKEILDRPVGLRP